MILHGLYETGKVSILNRFYGGSMGGDLERDWGDGHPKL